MVSLIRLVLVQVVEIQNQYISLYIV